MAHDRHAAAAVLCPACDFGPFLRNAYWTGKLLVAGDFIAEQRYFMEKERHHNLHLHGSGAICGLKVVAHDTDACRDRFVCVEPGTAIDCCGHEIVLNFKECIELSTIPALKALKDKGDKEKHNLQVCIRYRECETETVPVLYDECGCDNDKCAPNRILESPQLDVMVVPKSTAPATKVPDKCGDLWRTSVTGCAHCDQPDCIVLATITDYVVGDKIVNPLTPPETVPDGSVAIDNYSDRQILPSAQLIKSVIDCMLQKGPGGGGPGSAGKGIDAVDATFVPCNQPGTAKIDENDPNKRKLVLEIPKGCDGIGLEKDLTRIDQLSWKHGEQNALATILINKTERKGFVIHFTAPVLMSSIDSDHVFQVLIEIDVKANNGLRCRCPLNGDVTPVKVDHVTGGIITQATATTNTKTDAIAFLLPREITDNSPLGRVMNSERPEFWVILRCDFVLDENKRAVDGNFVRGELPTGDHPAAPDLAEPYGIQGGTFESWFQINRP